MHADKKAWAVLLTLLVTRPTSAAAPEGCLPSVHLLLP